MYRPLSKPGNLSVRIKDDVIEQITQLASLSTLETGGILIGAYYDEGLLVSIELATPPPADSSAGSDWFVRGAQGLASILADEWTQRNRRYYVGEWHFHPFGLASPSLEDQCAMSEIASDRRYECNHPILCIASPATLHQKRLRTFAMVDGKLNELLYKKELPGDEKR